MSGGFASALTFFPLSIGFGMIAFAPLGDGYAAAGVVAGLFASILVGLVAALVGGMPGMQSGAHPAIAILFGVIVGQLMATGQFDLSTPEGGAILLTFAFFGVFLAGVLQFVFGLVRLGHLIKNIPHPVHAGFFTGAGCFLILSQSWEFFGIPRQGSLLKVPALLPQLQPLTLLVGLSTLLVTWFGPRISKKIPPPILGVATGTAIYHLLIAAGFQGSLGETLGSISGVIPSFEQVSNFVGFFPIADMPPVWGTLIPGVLSLAILGALASLLTGSEMESITFKRAEGERILFSQGLANMASACSGGLMGAAIMGRTQPSLKAGGKTGMAGVFSSLILLAFTLFLASLMAIIPKAALAGMLVFVGTRIVDSWTVQTLVNNRLRDIYQQKELLLSLLLVGSVVLVTLVFNLVIAVGVGVMLALVLFVTRMSKSVVRKVYLGNKVHSRKQRNLSLMGILEEEGHRIAVVEVEGTIFFGTADKLSLKLESLAKDGADYIVLDLRRVRDIDSTGAQILKKIHAYLKHENVELVIGHLERERRKDNIGDIGKTQERRIFYAPRRLWKTFEEGGVVKAMGEDILFNSTDRAMEYCENRILEQFSAPATESYKTFSSKCTLFKEMTPQSIDLIKSFFVEKSFSEGSYIFLQGDPGDALYLLEEGEVCISLNLTDSDRKNRILTMSQGTVFGEMALLDGFPRSANVHALTPIRCHELKLSEFERMKREHPELSFSLVTNLCLLFVARLRNSGKIISELSN